jgi:hypothetical protein
VEVATKRVAAERLGESSVVSLSVLDESPQVAARTASALSDQVVTFMNDGNRGRFDAALADVTSRLTEATRHRDALQRNLAFTDGLVPRENVEAQLASAQQNVNHLLDERSQLSVADVSRDQVVALDPTRPIVDRVPSELVPRSALAVVLGLLVGLAASVLLETLRPRMAGIRVLARTLDAPILGSTGQLHRVLAGSMTLAARRQGVETLVLVGVDDRDEKVVRTLLESLPHHVEPAPAAADASANGATGGRASSLETSMSLTTNNVRFTDRFGVTPAEELAAGVVVVSAGNAQRTSVDHVEDMVRAMRWPVVGIVEVTPRRTWLVSQ